MLGDPQPCLLDDHCILAEDAPYIGNERIYSLLELVRRVHHHRHVLSTTPASSFSDRKHSSGARSHR